MSWNHSVNRQRRRRLLRCMFTVCGGAGISLVSSCSDTTQPTRVVTPRVGSNRQELVTGVSTVSFDVSINSMTTASRVIRRPLRLHVDRASAAGIGWTTTITILDDPAMAAAVHSPWRVARFDVDARGVTTVRRADGSVMPWPVLDGAMSMNGVQRISSISRSKAAQMGAAKAADAASRGISTVWIDAVVRSTGDCAREADAAIRGLSVDHRDSKSLDHYMKQTSHGMLDIAIDPVRHAVVNTSINDGMRLATTSSEYAPGIAGVLIRRAFQTEIADNRGRRTMAVTLSHVSINGQGVVP